MPHLTVIICTYDRYELMRKAVASIAAQEVGENEIELLVIDNSSNRIDQTEFFHNVSKKLTCSYIIETRPGLSRARNVGVSRASAEIVAFIDDDAVARPNWATETLHQFVASPEAGAVGGPVRPIWPDQKPSWIEPSLEGYFSIVDYGDTRRDLKKGEWLAGTNVAFRKNLLLDCGGFNENLGRVATALLSNEEVELLNRFVARGYSIKYAPLMVVDHHIHEERLSHKWLRQRIAWQAISEVMSNQRDLLIDQAECINLITRFLSCLPPRYRGIEGLFIDISDASLFASQGAAISALIRLLAANATDWNLG